MEYAGYVRRGAPTDWSKVTGDIAQRIGAVEEGREKERDKLEKLFADTTKVIGDVEMGMNPEFNETILYTADKGRELVYDAYKKLKSGQMSPREYRNIQNNVQARWAEYDTAVKQKNNRFAEIEKRTREGTNSEMELWQNKKAAEMAAFKEYSLEWGSNGNLVYAKRDDKGNIIPGSVMPISALNKTPNVLVDRFNLTEKVGKYKKNFGAFEIEEGGFILGGAAVEEKFNKAKESVIGSLYTNDNDYGRALVDSGYDNFVLYQEGEEVPEGTTEDGTPLAVKMIFDKESKTWTSVPTEKQKAYARRMAGQAIDTMVGYKKRKVKQPSTKLPSQSKIDKQQSYLDAYELTHKIAGGDKNTLDTLIDTEIKAGTVDSYKVYPDRVELFIKEDMAKAEKADKLYEPITIDRNNPEEAFKHVLKYSSPADLKTGWKYGKAQFGGKEETIEIVEGRTDMSPAAIFSESDDIENKEDYSIIKKLLTSNTTSSEDSRKKMSDYVKDHISEKVKMLGGGVVSPNDIKVTFSNNNQDVTIQVGDGEPQKVPAKITSTLTDPFRWSKDPDIKRFGDAIVNAINSYKDKYNESLKAGGTAPGNLNLNASKRN
tara:strand:- start:407 stop:2209 length:1803 start_codon:yes stop_codon:yes gene_type:complete